MAEIALTRVPGDRRLHVLEGVGTLRVRGWLTRTAVAAAGDRRWDLVSRGILRREVTATEHGGVPAGRFRAATWSRGGEMTWGGRRLRLRADSMWRSRYALQDGDVVLATVEGKGWGRRPVRVVVDDPGALDPGLLLAVCFVVHGLTGDESASAAAASG